MKRRDFVKHTGHGLLLPGILGSMGINPFGKSMLQAVLSNTVDTDHVLVLIYLNGGNDGLNTVIPMDKLSELNAVRPQVVLPQSSILSLKGTELGLHPSLDVMSNLFSEKRLKIIQNVGYPEPNYSHFRSTDIWMSASDSDKVVDTGWMGRYLNYEYPNYPEDYPNETMPDPLALEMGNLSSLMYQGPTGNMGLAINDPDNYYQLIDNKEDNAPDTKAGRKLTYVRHIIRQAQTYGKRLKELSETGSNKVDYPEGNGLADQLKVIARLIAGGSKTRVYMAIQGGYDTHDKQVLSGNHAQGEHADLLRDLDSAIGAFLSDLEANRVDDRVMGMTFSEFGRRIVSNASMGTDHGAAAPMFVFGNAVEGGVLGSNPDIRFGMTNEDNLPMEIDFRQVYASVLQQWLCVEPDDSSSILLRDFDTLPIAPDSACMPSAVHEANVSAGANYIDIHPNPMNGMTTVDFLSNGNPLSIDILDAQGRIIRKVTQGKYPKGTHKINVNTDKLPSGTYFFHLRSRGLNQAKQVVKI